MSSPFPGMDPWLENPARWPSVHLKLIAEIEVQLTQLLRPKYVARAEDRVYISDERDPGRRLIIPDVRIVARDHPATAVPQTSPAMLAEPIVVTTLLEEEVVEHFIEVISLDDQEVVTVLEVLSPTNKVPRSRGQDSYLEKRRQVMRSSSHWVEIDLLRDGERMVTSEILPPADYLAYVSRAGQRKRGLVWPVRLEQRLPVVRVPVRAPDPDAPLDLQAVLESVYDRYGYDLDTDYSQDPVPPLSPAQARWADDLLRQKGLR